MASGPKCTELYSKTFNDILGAQYKRMNDSREMRYQSIILSSINKYYKTDINAARDNVLAESKTFRKKASLPNVAVGQFVENEELGAKAKSMFSCTNIEKANNFANNSEMACNDRSIDCPAFNTKITEDL